MNGMVYLSLTFHSTQYRSFRRRAIKWVLLCFSVCSLCLAVGIYAWRWHLQRTHTYRNQDGISSASLTHGCERDMCLNASATVQHQSSSSSASGPSASRCDDTWYEVATCIARLGVVVLYFFLCDRWVADDMAGYCQFSFNSVRRHSCLGGRKGTLSVKNIVSAVHKVSLFGSPSGWPNLEWSREKLVKIVIGPICMFMGVCLWVCCHDNSKLRASIFTKLGL